MIKWVMESREKARTSGGGREKSQEGGLYALECLCSCLKRGGNKREESQTEGEAEHPGRTGQAVRADDGGRPSRACTTNTREV